MDDFVEDFSDYEDTFVIDEIDIKTNMDIDKVSDDLDDLLANL